jgi:ferredoxin
MSNAKKYDQGLIYTAEVGCVNCKKCLRVCPIKSANVTVESTVDSVSKHIISVDQNECVLCGACIDVCPVKVRLYRDDTEPFFEDLLKGKQFTVIVAPAFYLNYPDTYRRAFGYLKNLGVNKIYSVSFGADITTWAYMKFLKEKGGKGHISQPCPSVVSYVEKHHPALLPHLIPIQSPMMCTAIYLKKYLNVEDDLVFLSPCIGKKYEIDAIRGQGMIKYNVTSQKLMDRIKKDGINLSSHPEVDEDIEYGMGALFSVPGGLRENVEYYLGPGPFVRQIEGELKAYEYLETFSQLLRINAKSTPILLDILNCYHGCNHGTATEFRYADGSEISYQASLMRWEKHNALKGDSGEPLNTHFERLKYLNEKLKDLNLDDFLCEYKAERAIDEVL